MTVSVPVPPLLIVNVRVAVEATVTLPNPRSPAVLGGKRFTARRWLEGVTAWVGWHDLDQLATERAA